MNQTEMCEYTTQNGPYPTCAPISYVVACFVDEKRRGCSINPMNPLCHAQLSFSAGESTKQISLIYSSQPLNGIMGQKQG